MAHKKQKTDGLRKFFLVLVVLIAYTLFAIHSYGLEQGLSVTALMWAFFVFATPIADAGFLVAFPIRLITGIKMLYTQIGVWIFGAALVASYLVFNPAIFDKTGVLQLFHTILVTPWPLWLILILSWIGTFVSIVFDDNLVDVATAKNKQKSLKKTRTKFYFTASVFTLTFVVYIILLHATHTTIKII